MSIITKQKVRKYAVNELKTVDGITNPTLAQIQAKEKQILSWPIIQAALAGAQRDTR